MLDATFNFLFYTDFPEYKWQLSRYFLLCDALSGGFQSLLERKASVTELVHTTMGLTKWVTGS